MMCFCSLNFGAHLSLFGDHLSKEMKMVGIKKGGCPKGINYLDIVTKSYELLGKKKKLGMKRWSLNRDFTMCYAKQ